MKFIVPTVNISRREKLRAVLLPVLPANRFEKTELTKADRTVGVTVIYFPMLRQAQPDFFRECFQLRKDVTI